MASFNNDKEDNVPIGNGTNSNSLDSIETGDITNSVVVSVNENSTSSSEVHDGCWNLLHVMYEKVLAYPDINCLNWCVAKSNTDIRITQSCSYQELFYNVIKICSGLHDGGIVSSTVSSPIILCFSVNGLEFITCFLACLMYGAIAVPVYPPSPHSLKYSLKKLYSITNTVEPQAIIIDGTIEKFKTVSLLKLQRWPNKKYLLYDTLLSKGSRRLTMKGGGDKDNGTGKNQNMIMPTIDAVLFDSAFCDMFNGFFRCTMKCKYTHIGRNSASISNDADVNNVDALAFLQFTSGSTYDSNVNSNSNQVENSMEVGKPKGVMVSMKNLCFNCMRTGEHFRDLQKYCLNSVHTNKVQHGSSIQRQLTFASWLPPYHDYGLVICYLTQLTVGGRGYYMSPIDFISHPLSWLTMISELHANVTAAPNFALQIVVNKLKSMNQSEQNKFLHRSGGSHNNNKESSKFSLSSLYSLSIAAEPVKKSTINDFLALFQPHGLNEASIAPAFGLAENVVATTKRGISSLSSPLQYSKLNNQHVSLGSKWYEDAVDIKIVDPVTLSSLPDATIGEIWLHSPSTAKGYYGLPHLSKYYFNGKLSEQPHNNTSYLRTGDEGYIEDGHLYLCGRIKDIIIVRGEKFYSSDIEAAVEQHDFKYSPPSTMSSSSKNVITNTSRSNLRPGCVCVFAVNEVELVKVHKVYIGKNQKNYISNVCDNEDKIVVMCEIRKDSAVMRYSEYEWNQYSEYIVRSIKSECNVTISCIVYMSPKSVLKTSSGKLQRVENKNNFIKSSIKPIFIYWSLHNNSFPVAQQIPVTNSRAVGDSNSNDISDTTANDDGNHVCIIGAGISGLRCAWLLLEKGYKVTLIESAPEVGGKCRTLNVNGVQAETGAALIPAAFNNIRSYGELKSIMKQLNIINDTTPTSSPLQCLYVNTEDFSLVSNVDAAAHVQSIVRRDMRERYKGMKEKLGLHFTFNGTDFPCIDSDKLELALNELSMPVHVFLKKYQLSELIQVAGRQYQNFGYGSLDYPSNSSVRQRSDYLEDLYLPALYFLRYVEHIGFMDHERYLEDWIPVYSVPGGVQSICLAMKHKIQSYQGFQHLYLSVDIKSIRRSLLDHGSINITATEKKSLSQLKIQADKLIVACPVKSLLPLLAANGNLFTDATTIASIPTVGVLNTKCVTDNELQLFQQVRYINYWTITCTLEGFYTSMTEHVKCNPDLSTIVGKAEATSNPASFSYVDAAISALIGKCLPPLIGIAGVLHYEPGGVYTIGAYTNGHQTQEQLLSNIHQQLAAVKTRIVTIYDVKCWEDYFAHVNSESIKSNFYQQFTNLQGNRNTYFVNSLGHIETMESAVQYAKAIITEHFPAWSPATSKTVQSTSNISTTVVTTVNEQFNASFRRITNAASTSNTQFPDVEPMIIELFKQVLLNGNQNDKNDVKNVMSHSVIGIENLLPTSERKKETKEKLVKLPTFEMNRDTHFFEYGGNSETAVYLCSQLSKRLNIELSAAHLYQNPTPAELSSFIQDSCYNDSNPSHNSVGIKSQEATDSNVNIGRTYIHDKIQNNDDEQVYSKSDQLRRPIQDDGNQSVNGIVMTKMEEECGTKININSDPAHTHNYTSVYSLILELFQQVLANSNNRAARSSEHSVEHVINVDVSPFKIRADSHFFECGGTSESAVHLCSMLSTQLNIEISAVHLYQHPTPAELTTFICGGMKEQDNYSSHNNDKVAVNDNSREKCCTVDSESDINMCDIDIEKTIPSITTVTDNAQGDRKFDAELFHSKWPFYWHLVQFCSIVLIWLNLAMAIGSSYYLTFTILPGYETPVHLYLRSIWLYLTIRYSLQVVLLITFIITLLLLWKHGLDTCIGSMSEFYEYSSMTKRFQWYYLSTYWKSIYFVICPLFGSNIYNVLLRSFGANISSENVYLYTANIDIAAIQYLHISANCFIAHDTALKTVEFHYFSGIVRAKPLYIQHSTIIEEQCTLSAGIAVGSESYCKGHSVIQSPYKSSKSVIQLPAKRCYEGFKSYNNTIPFNIPENLTFFKQAFQLSILLCILVSVVQPIIFLSYLHYEYPITLPFANYLVYQGLDVQYYCLIPIWLLFGMMWHTLALILLIRTLRFIGQLCFPCVIHSSIKSNNNNVIDSHEWEIHLRVGSWSYIYHYWLHECIRAAFTITNQFLSTCMLQTLWLKFVGADIRSSAVVTYSTIHVPYQYIHIGRDSFLTEGVTLGSTRIIAGNWVFGQIICGENVFIGNRAIVQPNVKIPNSAVVAAMTTVSSTACDSALVKRNSGNRPVLFMGVPCIVSYSNLASSRSDELLLPGPLVKLILLCNYIIIHIIWCICLLPGMLLMQAINTHIRNNYNNAGDIATIVNFILLPLVLLWCCICYLLLMIICKWLLIGKYTAGMQHDYRSIWYMKQMFSRFCFTRTLLFWFISHWLTGSEINTALFRALGCKVGSSCWIGSAFILSDYDQVEVGSYCDLSSSTKLLIHTFENRKYRINDKIILHDYVKTGSNSWLLPGTICESYVTVKDSTLILKNSLLKNNTIYQGTPATNISTEIIRCNFN